MKKAVALRKVCCVLVLLYLAAGAAEAGAKSGSRKRGRTLTTSKTRNAVANRSSGLTIRQRRAARSALAAIRKLQSATRAGICYGGYRLQLHETWTAVDAHLSVLPEGTIKGAIEEVMDLYVLALQQWQGLAQNPDDSEEYENTGPSEFARAD